MSVPGLSYFSQNTTKFWLIVAVVVITRLLYLGDIPAGLNQDEAYAGYEAFSIFTTGADSWGYRFPIYLMAWGSGMNALYSYLTIPFLALFGVGALAIRMPQALLGILSCCFFYHLASLVYGKKIGLWAFFLSAIVPVHIMASRWGLECNVAPFFIVVGFYFYMKSFHNMAFLFASSLFYALGVYSYACCGVYIVFTYLFQLLCLFLNKCSKKTCLDVIFAGLLFTLFMTPYLLFIAINQGMIPEITSDFLTLPKLLVWRGGEIGWSNFLHKAQNLWHILYYGHDSLIWNSIKEYGLLYSISLPFLLVGFCRVLWGIYQEIKNKTIGNNIIFGGTLMIGFLYGCLIEPNVNRINFLWFNLILTLAVGLDFLCQKKQVKILVVLVYLLFFTSFCWFYFGQYNLVAKWHFEPDMGPSLQLAKKYHERTGYPVYLVAAPHYPKLLFYNQISPSEYQQTVQWHRFPAYYLSPKSISFYYFKPGDYGHIANDIIYVIPKEKKYLFGPFDKIDVGMYSVVVPR